MRVLSIVVVLVCLAAGVPSAAQSPATGQGWLLVEADQHLVRLGVADGSRRVLADTDAREAASWRPGRHVAAVSRIAGTQSELLLVDAETGALSVLEVGDLLYADFPSFSWDGSRIAFQAGSDQDLFVAALDEAGSISAVAPLTTGPDVEMEPTWSPDGSRIAYAGSSPTSDTVAGLWTMAADGSDRRLLVDVGAVPSWSPAGTTILFRRVDYVDGDLSAEIWAVEANGSDIRRISADGEDMMGVAWFPDGTRIGYVLAGDADGLSEVGTMAPDGSDRQVVSRERLAGSVIAWGQ